MVLKSPSKQCSRPDDGETLFEGVQYRYRSIRTPRSQAILQVQHQVARACRRFLDHEGFVELLAPIIGPITDPGIRGAGIVSVPFYGKEYVLMSSMIFYKQMAVASIPCVYSFSPNVRLEPSRTRRTGRHLAEFYQVDLEVAFGTCSKLMDLGDKMLFEILHSVRKACSSQLELLGRTLSLPPRHLPRFTHKEALDILRSHDWKMDSKQELSWEAEQFISCQLKTPFWITDYPAGSRGFYYLQDPKHKGILRSMDLLLPEGYGEIASGGEREHTVEGTKNHMVRVGEDPARFGWYLDMLAEGIPPSAGFGIGLERLTRYICGVAHIWECSPFPKVPGIA
ncbi:MAG: asparagine synthetase A [Promethearchaeota archaeon]